MARRTDIERLRRDVGTFEAPIGAVQLPETGVKYDTHGNPKPLQSGQDEHPEPGSRTRGPRKRPEPDLVFTTDLFAQDPEERTVMAACHKALAGRQITEAELRSKLRKGEHAEERIEAALASCRTAGLIDDHRYAVAYVESRVRRGHGAQRIRQDLARRGIDRALVDSLLTTAREEGDLEAGAEVAARKKFARVDLEDAASRAKSLRWLMGRGYSGDQAHAAIRVLREEREH